METEAVKSLSDLLLSTENLIIMVAAWVIISSARKIVPKFFEKSLVARLLPILPMAITCSVVWLPGLRPEMGWGATLLLGVVLGWGAGQVHKVVKQTFLGEDKAIKKS